MPARSVSVEMELTKHEVDEHLKGRGGVWDFLVERWETYPPTAGKEEKTMWDIALIEAILRPTWPPVRSSVPRSSTTPRRSSSIPTTPGG